MAFMRGSLDAQRILWMNGAVLTWIALAVGFALSLFLEWGAPSDAKLPPPSGPYVPIEASVFLDHNSTSNMVRVYYPAEREEAEAHALPVAPYLHNGWAAAAGFAALMKMPTMMFSWVEGMQSLYLSIDSSESAPPPVDGLSPSTVAMLLQGAVAAAAGADDGKGAKDIAAARRTLAAAVAAAADRQTVAYAKRHAEEDEAPLPVVVFSHGLGGVPEIYSVFIADLVSHGWVVLAVEHRDGSAAFAATPEKGSQQSYITLAKEQLANLPLLHRLRNKQLQCRATEVRSVLDLVSWLSQSERQRDAGIAADGVRAARQKLEKRAEARRRMRKEMGLPDEPPATSAALAAGAGSAAAAAAIADGKADDSSVAEPKGKEHDSDGEEGSGAGAGAGAGAGGSGGKAGKPAAAAAAAKVKGGAAAKAAASSGADAEEDGEADAPPFNINSSILAIASILGGRLDVDRIAVMGHSFGAATSIASADADRRPRAVVALDPWMFPLSLKTLRGGLHHVPTLGMCGDHFTQWRENAEAMRLLLTPWRRGAFVASDAAEYAAALRVWEERSAASGAAAALPKGFVDDDDDDDGAGARAGVAGKAPGKAGAGSSSSSSSSGSAKPRFAPPPDAVVLPHHHHSNGVDRHGSVHPLFRCAPGSAPHPGNLLLTLRGSEHQNYNDFAVLGGKAIRAIKAAGPVDPVEGIAAIRALVRAFLVEHALRHPKPQQREKAGSVSSSTSSAPAAGSAGAAAASASAAAAAAAAAAGAEASVHVLRDATLALLDASPEAPALRHLCRRAWLPPSAEDPAAAAASAVGSKPPAGDVPTH